jgi:pyridoxal phosphate enzyme (YggS family)
MIESNVRKLKELINNYALRYHRDPSSITLLAVSKTQSPEKILQAFNAGISIFGENYLQEALPKMAALSDKKIEWHFIGPIQSNKTKKIAEQFSWAHCVSTKKIAERLNDQRPSDLPPLNICLQINISKEHTKSGLETKEAFQLAEFCQKLPNLKLRGLMVIPEPKNNFDAQRKPFQELRKIYDHLLQKGFHLDTLSMGMSLDLEAAIAEGATIVRIGTALFGQRNPNSIA